jgi:hypothetical protein
MPIYFFKRFWAKLLGFTIYIYREIERHTRVCILEQPSTYWKKLLKHANSNYLMEWSATGTGEKYMKSLYKKKML